MLIFSVFVSIGSSVIAAFLPSIRSMKLNPIEVIKNG
jgi:ABC-type antimicrobial peptide transport system permease subunit